jgi:hypothetical protein
MAATTSEVRRNSTDMLRSVLCVPVGPVTHRVPSAGT